MSDSQGKSNIVSIVPQKNKQRRKQLPLEERLHDAESLLDRLITTLAEQEERIEVLEDRLWRALRAIRRSQKKSSITKKKNQDDVTSGEDSSLSPPWSQE